MEYISFKAAMLSLVVAGIKTQTRRLIEPHNISEAGEEWLRRIDRSQDPETLKDAYLYAAEEYAPCRHGQIVEARGPNDTIQIRIQRVGIQGLCDLSAEEVKAEGFAGLEEFKAYMASCYKLSEAAVAANPLCWVVEFRMVQN